MSSLAAAISGEWTQELLVGGPPGARYDQTGDWAHVLSVEDLGRGLVRVGWDGQANEPFNLIRQHSGQPFAWSPGALHVAWYGQRESGFFVAVDGVEHPAEGITRSVPPTFSVDGKRVAFGVFASGVPQLMLDGQLVDQWRVAPIPPAFSPDGQRVAFVAENRELKPGERPGDYRQWVVLDGVAQPEAEGISLNEPATLLFSPDSRRLAYSRIEGEQVRLVVDDATSEAGAAIAFPTFSPDSKRLAYAVGTPFRMVLHGEAAPAGKTWWQVGPPVFSPDSSRLGYFALRQKDHGLVVIDGVEGPEYTDFWNNVEFSPDSRHSAYLALSKTGGFLSRSTSVQLVRDGTPGAAWDEVASSPHFSPDSRRVAFNARRGKDWFAVVDDEPGPPYEQVSPPQFSDQGRVGYLAKDRGGMYRVVVDGVELAPFQEPAAVAGDRPFRFSPGGNHVATAGRVASKWRPIVDDRVGPGGAGVGNATFAGDAASFLVGADDGCYRVSTSVA